MDTKTRSERAELAKRLAEDILETELLIEEMSNELIIKSKDSKLNLNEEKIALSAKVITTKMREEVAANAIKKIRAEYNTKKDESK